jgi:hypothetical protein
MKKLGLILGCIILAGCASVKTNDRINTNLRASEYNSLASQFYDQPTFVEHTVLNDGDENINVSMDMYGSKTSNIWFVKKNVDEYQLLIDKYMEWETTATARQDAFTKEIGRAPTYGGFKLKFEFHSGNANNHFLVLSLCSLMCIDEQSQYYSKANVIELEKLLNQLKSGKMKSTNIDAVYQ